jgi:type IV pilus assembly protein PilO
VRRAPLLLSLLAVVLITAVFFLFVISPMNVRIGELRDQLEAAKSEEMTLRTTLARLKRIQESELAYISAVGALETGIPPNPDLADFVDQLNVLMQETGILWQSITPGLPTPVEGQTYLEIPVTLVLEGQYFETLGYLYGLAELERLVVVDAVSIGSSQDEDGLTLLSVTLSCRVFTTGTLGPPPPEQAPSAPAEGPATGTETTTTTTLVVQTTTTTTGGG